MMDILQVLLGGRTVGRLATNNQGRIVFQYEPTWVSTGFDLSPGTVAFDAKANSSYRPGEFYGLPGVFNDSLPDGWGLLLMDRAVKQHKGLDPQEITPLDRLAYMGHRGMGALEYQPEILPERDEGLVDLAGIAAESEKILDGTTSEVLEQLRIYGGSPGGARPKVTVAFSEDKTICQSGFRSIPAGFAHWIVKFRNDSRQGHADPKDSGRMEKAYADMAIRAGLSMPDTALIDLTVHGQHETFFAVKRFDRDVNRKIHFLSLSGYAHANHREPCLDYGSGVLAATRKLTRSDEEVAKAFRLMVFNILAHNKDDHAKNFAFLRDPAVPEWTLSPAFDLTFNHGMANHHTTSVNGSGNPTYRDIQQIATQANVRRWDLILDEVRNAVSTWAPLAKQYGVQKTRMADIRKALAAVDAACSPTKG